MDTNKLILLLKLVVVLLFFSKNFDANSQSLIWNNEPSPLEFQLGETLSLNTTYNTDGNSFNYIWLKLERKNSSGVVQEQFNSVYFNGTDPVSDIDTINLTYVVPENIPLSTELTNGDYYYFLFTMWTSSGWTTIDLRPEIIKNSNNIGGTTTVVANVNVNHVVGSVDDFDRSKFIGIHASPNENEWDGDNEVNDLRDDFLNGLDVYMGRNTGGITWNLSQMKEDINNPGFVDATDLESKASYWRGIYANKTEIHQYEARNNLIIAAQLHPFWTGEGQQETAKGWKFANATATGDYMGRYIKEFHSLNGQPKPAFIEVINEPAYVSHGGASDFTNNLQEIAEFHNDVADGIKAHLPDAKVGGYTAAFPNFEKGDFQRWNNRWKLFMDVAGEKMDFWSIHLYDWPSIDGGRKEFRSGSNVEAMFDMMEQYSTMKFGFAKPFIISEYGAQTNDYSRDQWTSYRDWLHVRSSNSLLMSFMDRPNLIASALNFIITKAEWGYSDGIPYNHRLMRKVDEPNSYTGKWVYTDMVRFYELWSKVKGKRIDTYSDNLDIQVDGFLNGDKAYLVVNNLTFADETLNLNMLGISGTTITNIHKKQVFTDGTSTVYEDEDIDVDTKSLVLKSEATIILEYTFADSISLNETSLETKYYANEYLKPITANKIETFTITNVNKSSYGEAVLRIGLGRPHNLSLKPIVKINNTIIDLPNNWRGDTQLGRERFFGVLEIPIPYNLLKENNIISIEFMDNEGHISTVTMQVYNFSNNIRSVILSNKDYSYTKKVLIHPNPTDGIITIENLPSYKKVYIFDINGSKLKTFTKNETIDIEEFSKGIYILKTDNGFVRKIIRK